MTNPQAAAQKALDETRQTIVSMRPLFCRIGLHNWRTTDEWSYGMDALDNECTVRLVHVSICLRCGASNGRMYRVHRIKERKD